MAPFPALGATIRAPPPAPGERREEGDDGGRAGRPRSGVPRPCADSRTADERRGARRPPTTGATHTTKTAAKTETRRDTGGRRQPPRSGASRFYFQSAPLRGAPPQRQHPPRGAERKRRRSRTARREGSTRKRPGRCAPRRPDSPEGNRDTRRAARHDGQARAGFQAKKAWGVQASGGRILPV